MFLKNEMLFILLVSVLFLKIYANKVNFCSKQTYCGGTAHTICNLKHDCSANDNCLDFEEAMLNDSDKTLLLDTHNKFRSLVATGKALPGLNGQQLPTASDMAEMVWDKELEFISQCWANQCAGGHDKCRSKSDGTKVGQNLAFSTQEDLVKMIEGFYEEIKFTTENDITNYRGSRYVIGHFTQLAYYNSTQVGCGRVKYCYKKFKRPTYYLVCNYAIAGNLLGTKIYTKGEPCSSCSGKCHSTYAGLCQTPQSSFSFPDICSHSHKWNCKPILRSGQASRQSTGQESEKSAAQHLCHGFSIYFGIRLSSAAVAFIMPWIRSYIIF